MRMKLTDSGCNVPDMPTAVQLHTRWYVSSVEHTDILHVNLLWVLQLYHPVLHCNETAAVLLMMPLM